MASKINLAASLSNVAPVTVITKVEPAPRSNVLRFTGKEAAARNDAMLQTAYFAFSSETARSAMIDCMREALGAKPTPAQIDAIRIEFVIGRVAARLPAALWGPEIKVDDKLAYARKVVCFFAAPPKEGAKANKLRAGQLGRRNAAEHKLVRAADEAWSQVKAEIGIGAAKVQKVAKKQTRAASRNAPKVPAPKVPAPTAPTHSELVKPEGIKTADDAASYIVNMSHTLAMFALKHAKIINTDMGTLIKAFRVEIDKAEALRVSVKA